MFVFNLNENIKCIKRSKDNFRLYCNYNYGPYTAVIRFYDNKKMNESYIETSDSSYNKSKFIYNEHNGYYKNEEVEVFKIILS